MTEYVKILTGQCDNTIDNPPIKFNFKTDNFQNHSFNCISRDENILVTAHTGSGKTVIAEYAIAHYISKGKRVIYTSPIKALSNQKYKELQEKFNSVGLMTGDNKINNNADLVIMTTEILRNSLYDYGKQEQHRKDLYFDDNFIDSIGCVIFDEVHYINDKDRGHVWEETIILLNPNITLVMLSATIDKPEEFCKWIASNKQKIVNLIPTNHRVVPLEHYIYCNDKIHKIVDKYDKFYSENYETAFQDYKRSQNNCKSKNREGGSISMIGDMVKYLMNNNLLQTIFFSFSRKNCEKYAQSINFSLLDHKEISEVNNIVRKYMHQYEEQLMKLEQYNIIIQLFTKGISFHHSGLLPILKELVEILFQKGLVKILFATETFSVGVNMPTRSIVFTELEKPTNEGKRLVLSAEYKQMSGRAGRRGIDTNGYVILLPLYEFYKKHELQSIMFGKIPHIESKFQINYSFILKILNSNGDMNKFVENSMYNLDLKNFSVSWENDLVLVQQELQKQDYIFDQNIIGSINDYMKFMDKENNLRDMGISLNKNQLKEKKLLLGKVNQNKNNKNVLVRYTKYNELITKQNNIINNINELKNNLNDNITKYIAFLQVMGYISDNGIPTTKGIIASQINDCNPLLLTEMIYNNMFDDMEIPDICGLLGMFLDDNKIEAVVVEQSQVVGNKINDVLKIIDMYQEQERELGIDNNLYGYYNICYDYIDMMVMWADSVSYLEISKKYNIYEGNFIKLVLKLDKIVSDLIKLNNMYGNIKIIPVLEKIHDVIIKDIINIQSLYL